MALLGLILFVAGLGLVPLQETDIFFRLANGEQILRTGRVPGRNLFSFAFPDEPYLDSAWLFDLAAAGLHRLGGFPALVLAKTILVVVIFGSAYWLLRRRGAGPVTAALVLAAAAFCMRERLVERPHVLSLLGEVAVVAILPAVQTGRRRGWLLLPLVALWANFHAGAFIGPAIVALAGLGWLIEGLFAPPIDRRVVRAHAVVAALATLALMATPVGPGIFHYLTFHTDIFTIHAVDEFRSLTWQSDAPLVIYTGALLLVLGLGPRPKLRDLVPVLGVGMLAFRYVRFGADFALLGALLVGPLLSVGLLRWSPQMAAYRAHFERAAAALLALLALVPRIAGLETHGRFLSMDVDRRSLPLAALRFVDDHGLRERMYNDFETGAYLIWQGYPQYRVFVDPRLPAYPRSFHQLLGRSDVTRAEWTRSMDGYGVKSALIDYAGINRRVAWWEPEDWALVFRAQDTRVFVRRLEANRDLIAQYEIPASFAFTVEEGASLVPLVTPPTGSPVPNCEWQLRLGDLFFDLDNGHSARALAAYRQGLAAPSGCLETARESAACAWLGAIDQAAGRSGEALALLDRSLAFAPADTAVLANRALALETLGRVSEAAETWSRVASLSAGLPLGERARARGKALMRE